MRLFYFYFTIFFVVLVPQFVEGQEHPASLIADMISYDKTTGILIAKGNIKVFYENTTLEAQEISYDQTSDEINIIGKFTLQGVDHGMTSGNNARINTKLQKGIILGARALINEQLQISSQKLDRQSQEYNIFHTVIASTCYVCSENSVPFWQIRAKRISHNKAKRKIYFDNATLDFLGLPVLYIPKLNIPEPGVARASGVLVPQLSTSNTLGITTKIPYYKVINDQSDITLTPYISSKRNFILESQYRRKTINGSYELSSAMALNNKSDYRNFDGFFESEGSLNLRENYLANFKIDIASSVNLAKGEKSFKDKFNYADPEDDRLKSFFKISKTGSDKYFQLGGSFTQSFRYKDFDGNGSREEDPNVPIVLPEFFYQKNYDNSLGGGRFALTAQSVTLANGTINQYSRIGGIVAWRKYWIAQSGINFGARAQINNNSYLSQGDFYSNAIPIALFEVRYPIKRNNHAITHVVEPIAQVIWAPNATLGSINKDANTADSTTAEFEESNLFSINRFPGFDETEAGLRSNIGAKYLIYNPSGWNFSTTAGRVFRLKNLKQFDPSKSTGLDMKNSDYVGAFSLNSPKDFSLLTRLLLDDSFDSSKHETKLNFQNDKYKIGLGYVWLDKKSVLNIDNRQHEINLGSSYNLNQNWVFSADWRQNINTHKPINGNFGIMYENECAKVNLSLSLQYNESGKTNQTVGIQVFLSGLGSNIKKVKFNNSCGA